MISCTEFIPAYSELFRFLEDRYGKREVEKFWEYLFCPVSDRHPQGKYPLMLALEKEGIRGCFTHWSKSLSEEAADFTLYLNEKRGYFLIDMHRCPSKGRLLEHAEQTGLVPYPDYCLHCDYYRLSAEKAGLRMLSDFTQEDNAACKLVIYDPKVFDGKLVVDEATEILDRRASQNEYFHPGFHSSMNRGLHYLGENFGMEAVRDYLTRYTRSFYQKLIPAIREKGPAALEVRWKEIYEKEKAPQALKTRWEGDTLRMEITACPGLGFLKSRGYQVSPWYRYSREIPLEILAEDGGLEFITESYDPDTGAAVYCLKRSKR